MPQCRCGLALIALLAALAARPVRAAEPFYRETFPYSAEAGGKAAGVASGWKAAGSNIAVGKPSTLKVFAPGTAAEPPAVNSAPAGSEPGHSFWARTMPAGLLIYTDEMRFDITALDAVEYEQRLNGYSASTHLALLVDRIWYISDAPARQQQRGIWETVQVQLGGMTFGTTAHTPCVGPLVPANSGISLPSTGHVTAFGVMLKDVTGRVRLDNFTLLTEQSEAASAEYRSGTDYCPTGNLPSREFGSADQELALCAEEDAEEDCIVDTDQDGLVEREEWHYGTNPQQADTDADGHNDGSEVADGSSPLDPGSFFPDFSAPLCLPWNNFFGMWNIAEHVNVSTIEVPVVMDVKSISGGALESFNFALAGLSQADLLVHEVPLRNAIRDSYGIVCSAQISALGSLRTAMVLYMEENDPSAARRFQFALGAAASPGVRGRQVVPFNTYSPSTAAHEKDFRAANWITLVNQNDAARQPQPETGTVNIYNLDGSLLDSFYVTLNPGERRDFPGGHQFGPGFAGLVEFVPAGKDAAFAMSNNRYVYKNGNFASGAIATAFHLPAAAPSGQLLAVPLDNQDHWAVLEVANAGDAAQPIAISIYADNGEERFNTELHLAAKNSRHIIVEEFVGKQRAMALVRGSFPGSTVAVGMHYRRRSGGSVKYMFGITAREALGTYHVASFNSFLGQKSQLWGVNTLPTAAAVAVSTNPDGNGFSTDAGTMVARGMKIVRVDSAPDRYGTAVIAGQQGTVWWSVRRHPDYVVVLPTAQ